MSKKLPQSLLFSLAGYQTWVVSDSLMKLGSALLPVWQVGLIQSFVISLILFVEVVLRRQYNLLRVNSIKLIATRTVFFVLNGLCLIVALNHLPLTDFYTINFTIPLVTAVLAPFALGEKAPRHLWIALLIGFAGAVIAIRFGMANGDHPLSPLGLAAGIGNVIFFSLGQMLMRVGSKSETRTALAFYPGFVAFVLFLGYALISGETPQFDRGSILFIVLAAAAALTGTLFCIQALRGAPNTAMVVSFLYSQIVTGAVIGWLVFGQSIQPATVLGAAMIIAGGTYLLWHESRAVQVTATRAIAR